MIKRLLMFMLFLPAIVGGLTLLSSSPVYAAGPGGISANCSAKSDDSVCVNRLPRTNFGPATFERILTIVISIIAALSVLFIAVGGLRYVFSQGDPQAVGKAKGTIVYAAVGLIVAIVAQGIVVLVVNTVLS